MLPWKLFFRFFSAMVLFATGGFAAGHDLPLPFVDSPPAVAAPPAAPVADPTTTTTTVPVADPAPPVDVTTTTTAPPVVVDPVPVPVDPPATPTLKISVKPVTTTTTAPPAVTADPAPALPVDGDAPAVCAAAAKTVCPAVDPAPAADDSHAARVQRCQDWWKSLAEAFDHRPEWAARARQIADRCEEMITRWEEMEQRWEEKHNKGDHNDDGHPDNGWHNGHDGKDGYEGDDGDANDGEHQSPPPAQPQTTQVSRHGEGRH